MATEAQLQGMLPMHWPSLSKLAGEIMGGEGLMSRPQDLQPSQHCKNAMKQHRIFPASLTFQQQVMADIFVDAEPVACILLGPAVPC